MAEERDDLVILVDENGEEAEFEYLDSIEMNDSEYVVFLPSDQLDAEEIDEVVILKVDYLDNGEETFISIDDEKELNTVFEEFKKRVEEYYNDFDNDKSAPEENDDLELEEDEDDELDFEEEDDE